MPSAENLHLAPEAGSLDLDVLIIGGGFSGCLLLHKIRDELKLNVKIIEAGPSVGGTWYWNRYPGARVDCPVPGYELFSPAVWKDWRWKERYPSQAELKAYFEHVDRVLSISKDCLFNSMVTSAQFSVDEKKWVIQIKDGRVVRAKYFIPAVGFAAKEYTPDWKGLDSFRGAICHSANWPKEGVDVKGKRVAIIGTGSTGVQITQDWAKEAAETYVFQRTPNICLPMRQKQLDPVQQENKEERLALFEFLFTTSGGLPYLPVPRYTFDDSPEEREATYKKIYEEGGFSFMGANYQDFMRDVEANREAYRFWAKKTRARLNDPRLQDLLAPLEPPHPIGAKRASLEQDYYEQFNKPNVHLVNVKESPIAELRPNGIATEKEFFEVDIIAIATGFDSVTGGIEKVGLKDADGVDLIKRWRADGVHTYLGMTVSRCPNMFLPYSAHSPSVFSSGLITIEGQCDWICGVIRKMETDGISAIDVKKEAEQGWTDEVAAVAQMTVIPYGQSWYMGANIPGKRVESLFYLGGIPRYRQKCQEALDNNLEDFARL
ncbi:flavin-containing monooxygenase [Aspergillus ruber CBS 135680]|uniref:FAD/NAD(P)-binding domain-containing protein n=1 Tax=Aspergillus ruber (strain CBS 135680) TaxID=1388766 RepID=A0A017S4S2_ASPRC|nr:FAD/NAD(P)-binding domain-containing protein [Aspergillus ruber CBS 135680]EYE91851.1 FAD/NAD(P)-binding domain-containing protein [Aspergillus ruber CBS 135680]